MKPPILVEQDNNTTILTVISIILKSVTVTV